MLSLCLSMLGVVFVAGTVLFARVYTVVGDMENRIEQYILMERLSQELREGRRAFADWFAAIENRDTAAADTAVQQVGYYRYRALYTVRLLNADYDESPQMYFLNRGIVNGLSFIENTVYALDRPVVELTAATYNTYYQVLKVFDYLLTYTNYRYLSAAVASDVQALTQNMERIRQLRTLSVVILLVLVGAGSAAAVIITRMLSMHVRRMLTTAVDITRGNLATPDLLLTGPREFVLLKDKLNHMKSSLNDRIALESRLHHQELEHEKITKELEHARYLSLQAQINPHFLFNTLNIISHTALFERAEKTVSLINSLAAVFRYRLEFKQTVTLEAELMFVRQYLAIQKARFGERLLYDVRYNTALAGFEMPPFVIQPFVENAVKHGIEPMEAGGMVTVAVRRLPAADEHGGTDSGCIEIMVEDDGHGIPADFSVSFLEQEQSEHIGITNVIKRLTMYYGRLAGFDIRRRTETGGTTVTLRLPERR